MKIWKEKVLFFSLFNNVNYVRKNDDKLFFPKKKTRKEDGENEKNMFHI